MAEFVGGKEEYARMKIVPAFMRIFMTTFFIVRSVEQNLKMVMLRRNKR